MKHKPTYPPLQTCRKCGCGVPDLKKHTCAPRLPMDRTAQFTPAQTEVIQRMIDTTVEKRMAGK